MFVWPNHCGLPLELTTKLVVFSAACKNTGGKSRSESSARQWGFPASSRQTLESPYGTLVATLLPPVMIVPSVRTANSGPALTPPAATAMILDVPAGNSDCGQS